MCAFVWTKRLIVGILIGTGCLTIPVSVATDAGEGALEDSKIHFGTGAVDTAGLTNLLGATRLPQGRDLVLQIREPITPATRLELEQAGVVLKDYLPDHAYVVDLDGATSSKLAELGFVRWVGEFRDEWKLDPEFGIREFATTERRELAERGLHAVIVTLFAGRSKDAVLQRLEEFDGATIHFTELVSGNETISATVTEEQVETLLTLDAVQYVEEAFEAELRNTSVRWILQSNTLNVSPLYDNGLHGEGQIVGILDGRADQHHCALDDGKILHYNSSDGNDTHGTHVSGTAVGDPGTETGSRGVAYLANMVYNRTPSFNESSILQRLNLHHSQGARVHTNSWGNDGTTNYDSLARGFDSFSYSNEDDLVLLAVTNGGTLRNPENAKNLLAVGGSFDTPNQASHCTGGSGPTADGRRKPEIYAPGCGIISSVPSSCSVGGLSGTSMAAPGIAGAAALVRQYYAEGYYPGGMPSSGNEFTPSGALLKATLLNGSVDMTGVSGYPSNREGWGRLLADNALYFPGDARRLVVLADGRNAEGLSTGESDTYSLIVNGATERLNVTLVFTDPPASAGTGGGPAAINDLDLKVSVSNPFLTTYLGNQFSNGVSTASGTKDDRNNVEQVHIESPTPQIWTVTVEAAEVNVGRQGYALVVTGDVSVCGNNALDFLETCDPPGQPAGQVDECRNDCSYCGDAALNGEEECDDGNEIDGDGCNAGCVIGCLDADIDGVCNFGDNCPLTANPDQGAPALFGETILALEADSFGWNAPANVSWIVGDLGAVGTYDWFVQETALGVTSIPAPETPDEGDGLYWLFAPDCPVGSWSSGGSGECSTPGACPPAGRDGNLPAP
jgi:cysteine-rich repeat protein